ncbi:prefoldin subunit 3-like [Oppia nitens]|uniref:prefoldin subunit 3-like n=1 Tax=Oppia nitens TaxID=1686743 RepID=UPI0023DA97C9|nr:prefoldin subunit 3-like [Oppia nitens]
MSDNKAVDTTTTPPTTAASDGTTVQTTTATAAATEALNSLGIPSAEFVSDVDEFMSRPDNDQNTTKVLKQLDECHTKYRFMEQSLMQKKRRLKKQIPDIETSIDVLKLVKLKQEKNQPTESNFLLSDQVYMKATIPATDKVCLWLGANVMLEYTIAEGEELLKKNYDTATKNLQQIDTDLDFLRDQITTTEVNMARVYNWDVKKRQSQKSSIAAAAGAATTTPITIGAK